MSIQAEIVVLDIYYTIVLYLERKKANSILLIYYTTLSASRKKLAGETVRPAFTC